MKQSLIAVFLLLFSGLLQSANAAFTPTISVSPSGLFSANLSYIAVPICSSTILPWDSRQITQLNMVRNGNEFDIDAGFLVVDCIMPPLPNIPPFADSVAVQLGNLPCGQYTVIWSINLSQKASQTFDVACAANANSVPTVSDWGIIMLIIALALLGIIQRKHLFAKLSS